jgi:catechol 2,3-dioxygenase-like lactoylglutathione lyase family enzyme
MSALDQVTITASDFAASLVFYDAALAALGLVRLDELVDEEEADAEIEAAAWGAPDEHRAIWLVSGPVATRGVHVRFQADSQVQVKMFFDRAVASGGVPHSTPRRWTIYRRGEFHAIVRDPDGNLIEAVAAEPD